MPHPDDRQREEDVHPGGDEPWRPTHGLVTKVVTWGILAFMAVVVVAMVAILVWTAVS